MIGLRTDHEPEAGSLGLLRRPLCTMLSTIVLELVVIGCPLLALQRNRRARPELRPLGHGKRLYVRPCRACRDGRRHIDAGRGPRPVGVGRVGAVVRPRLQDLCGNGFAKLDAIRFRFAIGDRGEIACEQGFRVVLAHAVSSVRVPISSTEDLADLLANLI